MNAKCLALAGGLTLALVACSGNGPPVSTQLMALPTTTPEGTEPPLAAAPSPQPTSGDTAPTAAAAAADLLAMGFDFSHPIHIAGGDCASPIWGSRPTLQQVLKAQPILATAAIMTVVGPTGPAHWNTLDGHRWTQAEAIAARVQGVIPAVQRPWRFVRAGQTFVGSVPDSVTVWLVGGRVGDDSDYAGNCIDGTPQPLPGRSYLMLFGPQQDLAPPGAYRVILAAYAYNQATLALDGPWGRMWLGPPPPTGSRTG